MVPKTLMNLVVFVSVLQLNGQAEIHKTEKVAVGQPSTAVSNVPTVPENKSVSHDGPHTGIGVNTNGSSTTTKDIYDRVSFWVNLLLATVGVSGTVIAICTLRKIERQTSATEVAARAAMRSAHISADAGRAWLVPHVSFVHRLHDYARQGLPEISCMIVEIKNYGASPAEISKAKIVALLSPIELPSEPMYDELEVAAIAGEVVAPGEQLLATAAIRHHTVLTVGQLLQVSRREARLVCYGRIDYSDNSGRKRVTQFGYDWYARTAEDDQRPESMYRAFGAAYNFTV